MKEAFKLVKEKLFKSGNAARKDASKLLVVLTDGVSDGSEVIKIADELRTQGISIIMIGVGTSVDATLLANIAGSARYSAVVEEEDDLTSKKFILKMYTTGGVAGKKNGRFTS